MNLPFNASLSNPTAQWISRISKAPLYLMVIAICGLVGANVQAQATEMISAPVAFYQNVAGHRQSTAILKGHPTMLFLLTTWCSTCSASLQSLDAHADQLRADGLRLVILQTYQNEQGLGPKVGQFVSKWAPHLNTDNVTVGRASKGLETKYNPQHYPDLYYLIDSKGRIQAIDSAPSFTMDKILRFADGISKSASQ